MSTHRLLERARHATEIPLRTAHVERQSRQLGDCAICSAPLLLHFQGPGASGRFVGHDVARRRAAEARPDQSVPVIVHAADSVAAAAAGATQRKRDDKGARV
jgi:hypothetical protein